MLRKLWAFGVFAAAELEQYCLVADLPPMLADVGFVGSFPAILDWLWRLNPAFPAHYSQVQGDVVN